MAKENAPPPKRKRSQSPPQRGPRKRPGGLARTAPGSKAAYLQRQADRERFVPGPAPDSSATVADHYNAVPQRGRVWRSTESTIKNLRSYNNWVKSTLIQKFSSPGTGESQFVATEEKPGATEQGLLVLDIGCGKGGDLQKWANTPKPVSFYIGLDPASVSIAQARDRYHEMQRKQRRSNPNLYTADFYVKDCYGEWLGDIKRIEDVGITSEPKDRWNSGGFDVVSMMFCLHYAFESEDKARGMLRNVAGALKKGGRLIGVCPDSDVLRERITSTFDKQDSKADLQGPKSDEQESKADEREPKANEQGPKAKEGPRSDPKGAESASLPTIPEWGNKLYRVRFPANTPRDGRFKPPFGWKYSYFLEEAVEELPEYVVPWEAFRALAEDYNLALEYRKPFLEVWDEEKDDRDLGPLSVRMRVSERVGGELRLTEEEREAVGLYHAFCFYKL